MFWNILLVLIALVVFSAIFWLVLIRSCEHLPDDDLRALSDNELREYEILKKESEKNENLGT